MKLHFGLVAFLFSLTLFSYESPPLSVFENQEINERLKSFYHWPPLAQAMNVQGTKIYPLSERIYQGREVLRTKLKSFEHPLLEQAQAKALPQYLSWYCKNVLKRISSFFECEGLKAWADFKKDDTVEELARSWVNTVTYDLNEIPLEGSSERPLWSDDFWAMERGLTSYRYAFSDWFNSYREAIESYFQPQEWLSLQNPLEETSLKKILKWSPAEKYDLTLKDEMFSLTHEQKQEGEAYKNEEGEVEGWMGLCHGWAPASIMVPRPEKPLTLVGLHGVPVTWYPNDIKAMVTLAWANGNWKSNFVGRRCEQKKLKTYANGRIRSGECFDNNPATFHLALGNLIGIEKTSFVMDKAFDYQVWNQPIVSYSFIYFNPLQPSIRSRDWKKVAVLYDVKFKKKDRFQKPLTRGKFMEGSRERVRRLRDSQQDGHIKKIVGVIATVDFLVETTPPNHGPSPSEDTVGRDTYLYDLEIAQEGEKFSVTGGEWLQNNHPDFFFVPQKESSAQLVWDYMIEQDPLEVGKEASTQSGYPLCKLIKQLVEGSQSGETISYFCPKP